MSLLKAMNRLEARAASMANEGADHRDICVRLAEEFQLFDQGMFPTWLSRVVEGMLNDLENAGDERRKAQDLLGEVNNLTDYTYKCTCQADHDSPCSIHGMSRPGMNDINLMYERYTQA